MKNLLLVVLAAAIGASAHAQRTATPAKLDVMRSTATAPSTPVEVGEKTTKTGDTIGRSHIPSGGKLVYYYADAVAPHDSGSLSGFNAFGDKGWAERFDVSGKDSSVLPLGVFGYFVGRASATSTKTIRGGVWAQGPTQTVSGRPHLFFRGVPSGSPLNSVTMNMKDLRNSTGVIDTVILMQFPTIGNYLADSFFAGFDIPSGYTWGAPGLGGDTLSIIQDTAGVRYGDRLAASPVYTVSGADTIINTQNATLFSNGTWTENYVAGGNDLYNNFFIGVVFRVKLSVNGVTRNGLTVFGTAPNPASDNTRLLLSLKSDNDVIVSIADASGRIVRTMPAQHLAAGAHEFPLSTQNLASGIYYCLIRTSGGDAMGIEMTVAR